MAALETRTEAVIKPLYSQSSLSERIPLGTFPIELKFHDQCCSGVANVSLEFIPNAGLVFSTELADPMPAGFSLLSDGQNKRLTFVDRNVTLEVIQTGFGEFVPKTSVVTATSPTTT